MKKKYMMLIAVLAVAAFTACKKDFLDKKSDQSLLVPTTLTDFQALLDNITVMNTAPGLNFIASDDFLIADGSFNSLLPEQRNSYIWNADIMEGQTSFDWNVPYKQVFYANIVLDGLEALKGEKNIEAFNAVKGSALFYRSFAFYNLASVFAAPYQNGDADQQPGIPLRLSSNVNDKVGRGTVRQTYMQIINDLKKAVELLPVTTSFKNRPSKSAGKALLARVLLIMGDFQNAAKFAAETIDAGTGLTEYATLDTNAVIPFEDPLPNGNKEVIFSYDIVGYSFFADGLSGVKPDVYNSFDKHDLRKPLYFYVLGPEADFFTGNRGLCLNEQYLIDAECLVRTGQVQKGIERLNSLLNTRYEKGTFSPYAAGRQQDALKIVLTERRKELLGKDLRWSDLRRLNLDPVTAVTITRMVKGQKYQLEPGSARYTFPIPDDEITRSGIAQNPR